MHRSFVKEVQRAKPPKGGSSAVAGVSLPDPTSRNACDDRRQEVSTKSEFFPSPLPMCWGRGDLSQA